MFCTDKVYSLGSDKTDRHVHSTYGYEKGLDMSMDAGQEHAIQTFDQQLYAIAQQVKWSRPVILETRILRLCGFHSLYFFVSASSEGII
jgi:hypothetical protein